jgi:TonB-linked SusC/RagA family outer membrane protein
MSNKVILYIRRLFPLVLVIFLSSYAVGQGTVSGKVTSAGSGEPVRGASVRIKGATGGVTTDNGGNFKIVAVARDVLVITHLNYDQLEIIVGNQRALSIALTPSAGTLSEVVVTGYSTERKKDITGSVSVVDTKVIKSIPAGSAAIALQGQASGVNVISSGVPGYTPNIFIRGISSFGNTQPLVLVDGIQSSLDDISADDIESMQVLKDAGAASVYGVRGSNGVIVVTTKKGRSGRIIVNYDSYYGVQQPLKGNAFDLVNPEEYGKMYKQYVDPNTIIFANGVPDYTYRGPSGSGVANEGDPAVDRSLYNLDIKNISNSYIIQKINKSGTDWFREVFRSAPMQNQNISASGGNERATFSLSLGYLNQQGTLIETFLKRYSVRLNSQFNVTKNIRFGENAYFFYRQDRPLVDLYDPSGGNVIAMIYRTFNFIPPYDIAGNFAGAFGGPEELGASRAPVGYMKQKANNKYQNWSVVGNVFAEVDLFKNFTLRTSFGGTSSNSYQFIFAPTAYYDGNPAPNALRESAQYGMNMLWTNTLTYANSFKMHKIKTLVGTESVRNNGRGLSGSATTFFSDDPNYLVLTNGTQSITNSSFSYINTLFSLFGRIDYAFNEKYLASVTVRRDGSSVFGSNNRYGWFPSVSAGWRISEEKFMQNVRWINDLKLRGSYGVLGSQNNIGPGNAFTLFGSSPTNSYYDISGMTNSSQQGFYQVTTGNPETGWEENIVTNIGLDASLFNNKLDISVEWYKKSINGLLFPIPLPATVGGGGAPVVNIGDIQNKGADVSVGYRGTISRNWHFNVRGNITVYKNRIVEIPGSGYFDDAFSRNGELVRNQQGHPIGSFFGYEVIGLFQDDGDVARSPSQDEAEPGRFKYRDVDGDGAITTEDRTFFGNPNPDFTYGINLGLTYKDFDLGGVFYGSQGNDVLNNTKWFTHFFGSFPAQKSKELLNAWSPTNKNSSIPKIEGASSFSTNGVPNSYFMENGSFLKMKNLILGYTFRPELINKIKLTRLRIYAQVTNVFTITKYSGLDPELTGEPGYSSSFGIDYGNFPNNQRSFIFGLNLTF